jgi:hypothetical protein
LAANALPLNREELSPPVPPVSGRSGMEQFGQPGRLRNVLQAPLPALALGLHGLLLFFGMPPQWPAAGTRVAELLWLLWAPFWGATLWHVVLRILSNVRWKRSRGLKHLDWSPRRGHYLAAFFLAACPLIVAQWSEKALDLYLWASWYSQQWNVLSRSAHVGYTPGVDILWVILAAAAPVWWQATRYIQAIPPGRLQGLQRELARLRSEVTWGPEAWGTTVGEVLERWLKEIIPGSGSPPAPGASRWRQRQRWVRLRREIVAAWVSSPPDLTRANQALANFRRNQPQ